MTIYKKELVAYLALRKWVAEQRGDEDFKTTF